MEATIAPLKVDPLEVLMVGTHRGDLASTILKCRWAGPDAEEFGHPLSPLPGPAPRQRGTA